MPSHLEHDIFLLMLNLSQLKESEQICTLFLDALNSFWDGITLRLLNEGDPTPAERIEIKTRQHSFGWICLEGSLVALSPEEHALIRNAVSMMAIILENRLQAQLLSEENVRLETLVQQRTAALLRTNQELTQEIEERQRAEEALRTEEERFHHAFEAVNDAIWDFDAEQGGLYWSPQYYTMLGYVPGEFSASVDQWRALLHPDDALVAEKLFTECLVNHRDDYRCEARFKTRDGGWKWMLIRGKVIKRNSTGEMLRMIGTHTDLTQQKAVEAEIQQLNEDLEQRVRQRTVELETANKELQSFAYVVSHDLKAPLRAISRLASWLVQDYGSAFDVKGQEMIALLIGRVKRMDTLIDGILEYSRIGRLESVSVPIDLNQLVQEVIDSLAPPPHIRITITTPLPGIVANPTRMSEVFQNLLSNAIKFLDKPQGQITIACLDDSTAWRFQVRDNGPGIDPKYHVRIFEIFQTLHPRDEIESTGIGLAVVKKIVEFYGGKIWVESDGRQGSTFVFTLPKSGECAK